LALDWSCQELGTLLRVGNDRPSKLHLVQNSRILIVVGVKSPVLETFYFSSEEEAKKKRNKRLKKDPIGESSYVLKDLIRRGVTVKASEEKVKSVSGVCEKGVVKVNDISLFFQDKLNEESNNFLCISNTIDYLLYSI